MMNNLEFNSPKASLPKEDIYLIAGELKSRIEFSVDALLAILSNYQTEDVSRYEIDRCLRTLDGLHNNGQFLDTNKRTDSLAILLPTNLPLYSLLLFALIPSFQARIVNVRPNSILQEQDIIQRIFNALELDSLFPGIRIRNQNHTDFEPYLSVADLVVFTGKPANAIKLTKKMKKNSFLVINGAGHNPLVVTESADLERAVEGALLVKGFNGGQDCAGPDAILVHESIADQFIGEFQKRFTSLKAGEFKDPYAQIGPIHRFDEIKRLGSILHENRKDIVAGGQIDFRTGTVYPAVIVRDIENRPNYQEVYGPIAFIHPYRSDNDLAKYFEDREGKYQANRMYVSVYGHSRYISERDDTQDPGKRGNVGIILINQTVHDMEIGYNPYGGYSMGASGVIKKTEKSLQRSPMPVLIPQIIHDYILEKNSLPIIGKTSKIEGVTNPIINDFRRTALDVLGDNLVFGFVFGSVAKNKSRHNCDNASDLDTFICLKDENLKVIKLYLASLSALHKKYGLQVDKIFPAEIMTFESLRDMVANLHTIDVFINAPLTGGMYDHVFWSCVLNDEKAGFIGDGVSMSFIIKQAQSHVLRWSEQIIDQIRLTDDLPIHIREKFPFHNKADVIKNLLSMAPTSVIQCGLICDNSMSIINEKLGSSVLPDNMAPMFGSYGATGLNSFFGPPEQKSETTSIKKIPDRTLKKCSTNLPVN